VKIEKQVTSRAVALETTLLVHGVPRESTGQLAEELDAIVRNEGSTPALVGLHHGRPVIGLNGDQLTELLRADDVPKANTANLGVLMSRGSHAATTVSSTMELAAFAGLRVFATGGIGGVHRGYGQHLDISSDLAAFTRFPLAVVTSGVKSILDVVSTREALESLGVTVLGYRTDSFPAFYLRESQSGVDARMDDPAEIAAFIRDELPRGGRGIVIANPIPEEHELDAKDWDRWLTKATKQAQKEGAGGRDVTPAVLAQLHEISDGRTLAANIELVKSNARLAARIEAAL